MNSKMPWRSFPDEDPSKGATPRFGEEVRIEFSGIFPHEPPAIVDLIWNGLASGIPIQDFKHLKRWRHLNPDVAADYHDWYERNEAAAKARRAT